MSELSISAPAKGDPITAAWARAVTDAANEAQTSPQNAGESRFPGGFSPRVVPREDGEEPPLLPAPFTVRLLDDGGTPNAAHAWVYVPTGDADFVYLGATPCAPALSATDNGTGWFDLGAVPDDGDPRYIVLGFNGDGAKPTFDIALQTSRRVAPSGCCPGLPVVALARVTLPTPAAADEDPLNPATSAQKLALSSDSGALGLVQLQAGALCLPDYGRQSLDCVLAWFASGGTEAQKLLVRFDATDAVRVNGLPVVLDSTGLSAVSGWSGWYDLGAVSSSTAAWLVLDIAAGADYASMANSASPYARATVAASAVSSPPVPANIGNAPRLAPPVMLWRAVGAWYSTEFSGVQLVRSSINLPLAVPDAANVRDDGKLFASVEWGTEGQTQLRGFESAPTKTGAQVVAASGAKLPVRFPRSDGGAEVDYIDAANIAINDGGDLLFNGSRYAPQNVNIGGTNYTLLVKQ